MQRSWVVVWLALADCTSGRPVEPLFGNPSAKTGLASADCRPWCGECDGGSAWMPPADGGLEALVSDWVLTPPFTPIEEDPYAGPAPDAGASDGVCGVVPLSDAGTVPRAYRLVTFASVDAARDGGATVTHFGACGVCSTLENLAVYLRYNDLGAPVKDCGFKKGENGQSDFDADVECLRALGFDLPCAQIWAWNTANTRARCLEPCLANLNSAYHLADGTLNACLRCDEELSGPVFKRVAGRTRRNSGIPNAICRPCAEVKQLSHAY